MQIDDFDIKLRLNDLELRPAFTLASPSTKFLEIVKWEGESCYMLAHWLPREEGLHEMSFCGDRPFTLNSDEFDVFINLARKGQKLLDL